MSKIAIVIFIAFILGSCNEPNIIGYWKIQTKVYSKYNDSILSKSNNTGDLILSSDSTYLIKGFGNIDSKTPGWHTGGDEKGTWKGSTKKHLVLYPDYYRPYIPDSWGTYGRTKYKIIELSKTQLILSSLDSTRGLHINSLTKYSRH